MSSATGSFRYEFFLAYPGPEEATARALYHALSARAHRVFFDKASLVAGDRYTVRIPAAQAAARISVVLAARSAPGGFFLGDEIWRAIQLARDRHQRFEGVIGVAIISSTGKVIAVDMPQNDNAVTLGGFYIRGAARIARTLGYNVFDGVIASSTGDQQIVIVGMGSTSAILDIAPDHDPEVIRDAIMGVG